MRLLNVRFRLHIFLNTGNTVSDDFATQEQFQEQNVKNYEVVIDMLSSELQKPTLALTDTQLSDMNLVFQNMSLSAMRLLYNRSSDLTIFFAKPFIIKMKVVKVFLIFVLNVFQRYH